ncbi:hypothetical protein AK812_SmicGene15739 [Symbiodinium microadriaticum]|uniref:Uncharacterized protein n=1 Tax=Symbiodinium microadriaticum TaxID=2951 RepID=A0A1Q9E249_SYMMI|nr:hypothetical protein AK812_SmicGene15739 [Symbiodinium microadriaticum]
MFATITGTTTTMMTRMTIHDGGDDDYDDGDEADDDVGDDDDDDGDDYGDVGDDDDDDDERGEEAMLLAGRVLLLLLSPSPERASMREAFACDPFEQTEAAFRDEEGTDGRSSICAGGRAPDTAGTLALALVSWVNGVAWASDGQRIITGAALQPFD